MYRAKSQRVIVVIIVCHLQFMKTTLVIQSFIVMATRPCYIPCYTITPKEPDSVKQHRGRMTGISYRGNTICFGKYALQALEPV